MVGGDNLSYDEYLDLQMQSGKKVRTYFEICYYDADFFSFKGRIMLCVPVWNRDKVSYLSVPLGYRMW